MFLIIKAYIYEFHLLLFPVTKGMVFICQLVILHEHNLHTLCIVLHDISGFKVQKVLSEIGTSHI